MALCAFWPKAPDSVGSLVVSRLAVWVLFATPPALLKGFVWFWFSTPVLRRRVQLRILLSLPESALPSIPDLPRRPRHHRRRLLGERSRLSRGSPLSHYMHAASKLVGGYQLAVCFHKFLGACKCGLVRILAQGSRQRWFTCGEQTGCLGSFR